MYDVRQRSILAGLGISVWIPRLLATRKSQHIAAAIWRDQTGLDQPVLSLPQFDPLPAIATASTVEKPTVLLAAAPSLVPQAKPEQSAKARDVPPSKPVAPIARPVLADLIEPSEPLSGQVLLRFSIQAVEVNHWILLVDEQTLQNPAAKQLWSSICSAFGKPEQIRFSWPLADGLRWQHPLGAKAALNGFLFRLGMDKRIGLMGHLQDDVVPDRIERLPTLQELIEQPLKKRSLWLLLKQQ